MLLASATSKWSCCEIKVHLSYASTCFTLASLLSLKEIGKGNAFGRGGKVKWLQFLWPGSLLLYCMLGAGKELPL